MWDKVELRRWGARAVKVVGEAADLAVQLERKVTPIGLVALGAKLASSALGQAEEHSYDGWAYVDVGPLCDHLYLRAKREGKIAGSATDGSEEHASGLVHGVRVGWTKWGRYVDGPYTPADPDKAELALRELAWDQGPRLRYDQPASGKASLDVDVVADAHPSDRARDLWARVRPYLKSGRSVLLVGEPGTGKSTIARTVADLAGGRCLRIHPRALGDLKQVGGRDPLPVP